MAMDRTTSSLLSQTDVPPLPWFQLFVTYSAQFAEPITATVVYPFAPEAVRRTGITGGDERKTGYYAGIVESIFFLTECLTVYLWARASDRFGRRPILILGPLGLAIGMIGFGLSKEFWSLVVFRGVQGVFNGNIGVSKTVLAELSHPSNMAEAFSFIPVVWGCGSILGPIIGGLLAEPEFSFPDTLGRIRLLQEYPYLLPCLVSGSIAFLSFLLVFFGLKETLHSKIKKARNPSTETLLASDDTPNYGSTESPAADQSDEPKRPNLKNLLTPRLLITLLNYGFLAFAEMSYKALLPLMYSTSIPAGGLGFSTHRIGLIMGCTGICVASLQLTVFTRIIRRYGPRAMFITAMCSLCLSTLAFPCMSFFAKRAGRVDGFVLVALVVQVLSGLFLSPAYSSMQVLVVDSSPGKSSLASTLSVAQTTACAIRFFAPSVSSSLFALSVEKNVLGGYMVYLVILAVEIVAIRVSFMLPKKMQTL